MTASLTAPLVLPGHKVRKISGLLSNDVEGTIRHIAGKFPAALLGAVITTAIVAKLLDLTDASGTATPRSLVHDAPVSCMSAATPAIAVETQTAPYPRERLDRKQTRERVDPVIGAVSLATIL